MVDLCVVVPGPAEAARLVAIDRAAFPNDTSHFSADDYLAFGLAEPGIQPPAVIADEDLSRCVAVLRFAADEAEILTIGVVPSARRSGLGRALLNAALAIAEGSGAASVFLEVAEDNTAARTLYDDTWFVEVGRRASYYLRRDGSRVDALILRRDLAAI
ncbi:MAG: GNAT family N-acetyltransferase [Pseudomonadota bacterium]